MRKPNFDRLSADYGNVPLIRKNIADYSERNHVELVLSRIEQQHCDITADYDDWFRILMALANEFGEAGRSYAHRFSKFSQNYKCDETDKKFTECLNSNQGKIRIGTLMKIASDHGIDVTWSSMDYSQKLNNQKFGKSGKEKDKPKEPAMTTAQKKASEIAEFRFNVFTEDIEYRLKSKADSPWDTLDDRAADTFYTYVKKGGARLSKSDFMSAIKASDFSSAYDPFMEYLNNLPAYIPTADGEDAIEKFFGHLLFKDESKRTFYMKYLRKWFVNMVALAAGIIEENQIMPVLIGVPNTGKTFFSKNILPPELSRYFRRVPPTEDPKDKDLQLATTSNILMSFDEFMQQGKANQMKAFISSGTTQIRRAYDRIAKNRKRRASFFATGNDTQYLSDLSGDRRYLSVEIDGTINLNEDPLPYSEAYAEAWYLCKQPDFNSSLSMEEAAEITDNNRYFAEPNLIEETIQKCFRKPESGESGTYLMCSEIQSILIERSKLTAREFSINMIGKAMSRMGFDSINPHNKRRYFVIEVSNEEYKLRNDVEISADLNGLNAKEDTSADNIVPRNYILTDEQLESLYNEDEDS